MNKQYLIKIIKEELGMHLSEAKLSTEQHEQSGAGAESSKLMY